MSLGINHLSKYITPNTSGIIWLTDEKLSYDTPGVYEFNYLLDGILFKSLANQEKNSSNFFLGNNFGSPFFIGHIAIENKNDVNLMHKHFEVASSFVSESSTVYIFNRSKNTANINILKELSDKYKTYQFENLNI